MNTDNNKETKSIFNLPVVFVVAGTTFLIGFVFFTNFNNPQNGLLSSNLYSSVISSIKNKTIENQVITDQSTSLVKLIKAEKLDINKNPIQDIFTEVEKRDNIWTSIQNNQYIKITFEIPLTTENDITIFARTKDFTQENNLSSNIQVFTEITETDKAPLVEFTKIRQGRSHKVLLTNLKQPTDIFYLKINTPTILEIDFITDPDEAGISIGSGIEINSGIQMSATVAAEWACGDTLVDTRDSKEYDTVLIGDQCWMAENINAGTRIAGSSNQGTSCASIEKYCFDNNEANCTTDGGLYQWNQTMCGASTCNGTGEPPNDACATPIQGICPDGWHLPSHYELTTLERAVCTSGTCATDFEYNTTRTGWRGTTEGDKLKKEGLCEGRTPCGTSGFNGLLAGSRDADGSFYDRTSLGGFWSSTHGSSMDAWFRWLYVNSTTVLRHGNSKDTGFSIRCLKN